MTNAAQKVFGLDPIFRLRWRMEFTGNVHPVFGGWNYATQKQDEMAAFRNSSNLAFAVIEGERSASWEIERLGEMSGQDFIQFKWIAAAQSPCLAAGGPVKLRGRIVGMKIVGRNETAIIYINGQGHVVPTDPDDRKGFVRAWAN